MVGRTNMSSAAYYMARSAVCSVHSATNSGVASVMTFTSLVEPFFMAVNSETYSELKLNKKMQKLWSRLKFSSIKCLTNI